MKTKSETQNSEAFLKAGGIQMIEKDPAILKKAIESNQEEFYFEPSSFQNKTTQEIMAYIKPLIPNLSYKESLQRLNALKTYVDKNLNELKNKTTAITSEENSSDSMVPFQLPSEYSEFNALIHQTQQQREEEKQRIEKEKHNNYLKKQEILENLKKIIENDETDKTIREVKDLQNEWKKIKILPKDKVEVLWNQYHKLLDTFYDKHSINIELKELDRQKNLNFKIDLCKKVLSLQEEPSLKRSFILLTKYHDEFKNTGPVPKEYNEEIWQRFKTASDEIYQQKKAKISLIEEQKEQNLEKKKVLVDKAILIARQLYEKPSDWKEKHAELNQLMSEWKNIGPTPRKDSNKVWMEFKSQYDEFYNNRNHFFDQLKKEKASNLERKLEICKKAEKIAKTLDFKSGEKELKLLQNEWREVGPVPKKEAEAIWLRFRTSCDEYFNARKENFKDRRVEEKENFIKKTSILNKLEAIATENQQDDDLFDKLKSLQKEWAQIGHVSYKQKDTINKKYKELGTQLFEKFKKLEGKLKTSQKIEHYNNLLAMPNGEKQISIEEFKIKRRIEGFKSELDTLENNIQFFAKSKNADGIMKDFEKKIEKIQRQVEQHQKDLNVIRQVKRKETQKS